MVVFSLMKGSPIAQSDFAHADHARKSAKTDQPAVTMAVAIHRSCRNVISPGHFHEGDGSG
ncbi:hypothetical protein [Afipia birgiae]|jgi:hypothetical protein|uniref:hypothetical protein n=1 Tax=Afipia birgiae TaxID=151414 RepID=UPI0002E4C0D8|nr:hypothetical protein [Afipia birgiae]MBX9819470.1 hypothetical protein [Afipia birgiae]